MKPRMPYSPPPTPTITLSLTTSGACVIEYPDVVLATSVFQTARPVFASMAISCASSVPMNSVSPRIASPRLLAPQQTMRSCGRGVAIGPERTAGRRVERDDVVQALGDVHDAVDDQRRGLPVAGDRRLVDPLELQVLDVGRRDLSQRAVARAGVVAGVGQPVLRLARRGGQALRRHLPMHAEATAGRSADTKHHAEQPSSPGHGNCPFSESR